MKSDLIGLVSLLTTVVGSLLAYALGRRRSRAEARRTEVDTEVALVTVAMRLLEEFRTERSSMSTRISDLEFDRKVLERRVDQLELVLHQHGIDVPPIMERK